jgi:YD repeat-containing protein
MKRLLIALLMITAAGSSSGQQEPVRERGFKPEQVHQFNGLDTVNLFNGNLNLSIPLGSAYPVSEGLSYSFSLRYSGNVWKTVYHCTPTEQPTGDCGMRYLLQPTDNAGPGWRMSFGELRAPSPNAREYTATSMWEYRSPDASEHLFYPTLYDPVCTAAGQTDCDTAVADVFYTRDGTYLRLRKTADDARVVEYGNGQRQRFVWNGAKWRLQYIYSVSSTMVNEIPTTNYVKFEYPDSTTTPGLVDWKITDSHGREHWVYFQPGGIDRIELAAFVRPGDPANVRATYDLAYGAYTSDATGLHDGPAVSISEPCDARPLDDPQSLNFLTRLELPSAEHYSFAYNQPSGSCDENSATLTAATLPTGGGIAWKYQHYGFVATPLDYASGVAERLLKNASGAVIQKTTYEFVAQGDDGHDVVVRQCRTWTDTTCVPETKSVHHFTTGQQTATGYGPWFGVPMSPTLADDDGRPMSTQTFSCAANGTCSTSERTTYLAYQSDYTTTPPPAVCNLDYPCVRDRAKRVKSERIVYDSDGSREATTDYSLFDGLGHYRKTVTGGTFSSGNVRTTETDYNNHSRGGGSVGTYDLTATGLRLAGYTSLLSTDPWILGTYGGARTLEEGVHADIITCFDPGTGFLKRQRTLSDTTSDTTTGAVSANDLLAVFTRDSTTGYAQSEEYFGGDKSEDVTGAPNLPLTDACTLALPGHDQYSFRVDHTYQYGTLLTSVYKQTGGTSMPFFSVQNTIDLNTGLVSKTTDPAGVATSYQYDRMGRLDLVDQPSGGLADTSYVFTGVSGATPANVTVTTGSGFTRTSAKYEFDSVGRLWREHHLMPDESWSVIETRYDALGRQSSVSELETYTDANFTPAHKTVFSVYDAFGRAGSIVGPDGGEVTITYKGDRLTTRTVKVANGIGTVTPAVTVEERDRAGRLWQVTENGTDLTTYGYDPGNHLTTVTMGTQPARVFTYDGRGFLMSERHPESGTTTYEYDARGHVVKQYGPVATLTTEFDKAGRVLNVFHDGVGLLKEFAYDRPNAGVDYSMGKVGEAIRHNRSAALGDVMIKEKYIYGTRLGLLSGKETTITTVKNNVTTAGGQFTDSYLYTDLGAVRNVNYPKCTADCAGDSGSTRSVDTTFTHGLVTEVAPYTNGITYHPNGFLDQVRHRNVSWPDGLPVDGPLYTQTVANGMARPDKISVANYCDSANLRIDTQPVSRTVSLGSPGGLTVVAPGATRWQWYKGIAASSTPISGQTTNTLTSSVSTESSYWVRVGNGNCSIDSNPATVYVASCPNVTLSVSDPSSIQQGGSKTLHVQINDTLGTSWTIQWSDESQTRQTSVASFDRTVLGLVQTTDYTVTIVASPNCGAAVSNPVTVTVIPPTPAGVAATAVSAAQVNVSWNFVGQADQFRIERRGPGQASFVQVGTTNSTTMSYPDTGAGPNTAYLYRVKAVKANTASAASAFDLATTVIFSDTIGFRTELSAQPVLQLRTAANAVRALWSTAIGPFVFTDATLAGIEPKAIHVLELRAVLGDARVNLGLSPLQYTGPAPQALQVFNATDINDLRDGVR